MEQIYQKENESSPFLVLFSDGKKALLPFSCIKKGDIAQILIGTSRQYVSSPERTHGGWISPDKLAKNHGILLSNLIKKKFNSLFWRNCLSKALTCLPIKLSFQ
jgi:hypothetical protein